MKIFLYEAIVFVGLCAGIACDVVAMRNDFVDQRERHSSTSVIKKSEIEEALTRAVNAIEEDFIWYRSCEESDEQVSQKFITLIEGITKDWLFLAKLNREEASFCQKVDLRYLAEKMQVIDSIMYDKDRGYSYWFSQNPASVDLSEIRREAEAFYLKN